MRGPIATAVTNCINSPASKLRDEVADNLWKAYVARIDLTIALYDNTGKSDISVMEKLTYRSYIARHAYAAHKKQTTNPQ